MSWFRPGRATLAEPAQRTLLYLMAGPHAGVAVRQAVGGDTGAITGTLELPGLSTPEVTAAVRTLAKATGPAPLAATTRIRLLTESLAATGDLIWQPILAEWPDLRGTKVELAPVGDILYLPLHTALVEGVPACVLLDLSVRVPVHAPAMPPVSLGEGAASGVRDGLRDGRSERRTCHGIMDADEPWRSTVLLGHRPASPEPAANPLVILSGGRLAAFDTLPVLGALWPLPDPTLTADLLAHLHRALVGVPDTCSLAQVVGAAHRHGLCIAVWGPFVHFGA
ncbi:hypothetical protein M8C13_34050 [Crossiella sp. SN42]|uniref:hypothetical protein n=1 Tax=Crossiella sp. SN42 TaxID=2944808 RepID=UPI00207D146D|nr:hypothetical protein [Crossiella sp. SN42]MCO1580792.1 hypothetical protein [Crossiella sp. SN42]